MPGLTWVGDRPDLARRRVAVLFADLSGFTRLVQSVDPEEVYRVVRPLMDELVTLVRAHGGAIQQVLGDGFMAVFGLHSPGGDEPARAIRAGLALAGAPAGRLGWLPVHVGIEYGEVLVSPSWEPAAFAVWGSAVTLAKRLCDLAGPGRVYVGPQAHARGGPEVAGAAPFHTRLEGVPGEVLAYAMPPNFRPLTPAPRQLAEVA
ncbi:adenylate/guanylate cyclase domain-containing protein [Rhizomonospora bruguierae]|uniref:adenylate/guanylate cyclase domain-containing protein n=1 Tax=Rhizomonospora bruguierae TaxID=1581705 RepID=UPI001BCB6187|nr:adenylate/guanylate cyclase domain-containing protein [Micromonospora sp. NBRC 107566]